MILGIKKGLLLLGFLGIGIVGVTSQAAFEKGLKKWNNDSGELMSPDSLVGGVRVVSLFYTDCPNTCSLTIEKFKQLEKYFERNNISADFILMSLDPKNDTPSVLKTYRTERDLLQKNWHFLTSTETQVRVTAKELGYEFTRLDDHVFHRMKIFIFDSDNNIVDIVKMGTDVEALSFLNGDRCRSAQLPRRSY